MSLLNTGIHTIFDQAHNYAICPGGVPEDLFDMPEHYGMLLYK